MTRIVIPIYKGRLSELFYQCSHFEFVEIENTVVKAYSVEVPNINDLMELPVWLKNKGVTDVIAYKIDPRIIKQFITLKMNLFIGIKILPLQDIVADFMNGNLITDYKLISEITHDNEQQE